MTSTAFGCTRHIVEIGGPNSGRNDVFYVEIEYDDDNYKFQRHLNHPEFQNLHPHPWQMWLSDLCDTPHKVINLRKLCHDIDEVVTNTWSVSQSGGYYKRWDFWFTNKDDMDLVRLALGV